jgi:hypothetical protein
MVCVTRLARRSGPCITTAFVASGFSSEVPRAHPSYSLHHMAAERLTPCVAAGRRIFRNEHVVEVAVHQLKSTQKRTTMRKPK